MSHYEKTFSIKIPDGTDQPSKSLRAFYLHNGYTQEDTTGLRLTRGTTSASWWASDMTKLYTVVEIELDEECGRLVYDIVTTGQHLTDDDSHFWEKEARAAEKYLDAADDGRELVDLRPLEAHRSKKVKHEFRSTGYWAAGIVFLLIVGLGIIADRFGFI